MGRPWMHDTKFIVDWLTDGARFTPRPETVLADLCDQLVEADIPLWRVAEFVRTLHRRRLAGSRWQASLPDN